MSHPATLRYDPTTIRLHSLTAISVAALWIIGQTADWIPRGAANKGVWSVHVAWGFILAAVVLWRLIWRGIGGARLPAADPGLLGLVASATHYLLYALLIVVIGLGVANAFVRGYTFFEVASLPQIGDINLRRPLTHWHGLAANILLALAFLHSAAALAHHFILRDGVLRRMMSADEAH